jgi:hypothetical protein
LPWLVYFDPLSFILESMVPTLILRPSELTTATLSNVVTGEAPQWPTQLEVGWMGKTLVVKFTCDDPVIWCTMSERDLPLWDEEVVEVFLAPGPETPTQYFEFEVNPDGVLWDGLISCPTGGREGLVSGSDWDCDRLEWSAWRDDEQGKWGAELIIPLDVLSPNGIPREWRFNACRIERPMDGGPEFSAWSPTGGPHPEFHRPSRFGRLLLGEA